VYCASRLHKTSALVVVKHVTTWLGEAETLRVPARHLVAATMLILCVCGERGGLHVQAPRAGTQRDQGIWRAADHGRQRVRGLWREN